MRIGRFKISALQLKAARQGEFAYKQLSMLFSHGIVVIAILPREMEAEVDNWYEYVALWDKFEDVDEKEGIPFYDLQLNTVYDTVIPRRVL